MNLAKPYIGEYIGLTGAYLDGTEMLACGLATHFVLSKVLLCFLPKKKKKKIIMLHNDISFFITRKCWIEICIIFVKASSIHRIAL